MCPTATKVTHCGTISSDQNRKNIVPDQLLDELREALGVESVSFGGAAQLLYSRDSSVFPGGQPGPVCFPETTVQVAACVQAAIKHDRSFVPRGAGTGLAGGAIPCDNPVMIVTTRMNKILEVNAEKQFAWVEPGVINLDLTNHLRGTGLHFAPDPSSQQSCTIGGNVANNSGGPHCLAYGVTSAHILAVEVVLPDASVAIFGDPEGPTGGYDLRGAFVGGEGTLGVATRVAVRLTPDPPAVRTMLLDFQDVGTAADTVSAIIGAGIVPAAIEMMDQKVIEVVEKFIKVGYPQDAAAVLIIEVDGLADGVEHEVERITEIALACGTRTARVAADEEERARIWKGRKNAFGAIAQVKPGYYLHDTVIPRTKLTEVINKVYETAERYDLLVMNVFHAGDGNLHPLLIFDPQEEGIMDRVLAAGEEIVQTSLDAGGVLSGEHGIGLEKRRFMDRLFSENDLAAQAKLRHSFDPDERANPHKVLPSGSSCAEINHMDKPPEGTWV
ncbi:MAG: FAD-binding protein [Actinobacteria bacterium]|nr:FAD-binding protein [Actinomycetota bacterium]MBT5504840.1 FAD-binding protein [Actinomycetota bacterium]MBT7378562.1 FAD-binding protein [Actinomycetota bacterium]